MEFVTIGDLGDLSDEPEHTGHSTPFGKGQT